MATGGESQFYGTAFPDLEANENAPRKVELDQTVRDEQGRRRFHGAFTGGFSAGYYNSVGTKEGWAPSEFVSNKKDRARGAKRKPEDYMDDEDFGDHGIAPKQVRANELFSSTECFAGFRSSDEPGSSVSDVLKQLIRPCRMTVGMRLLRSMKRRYTASTDMSNWFENSQEEPDRIQFQPKSDLHGLGYRSLTMSLHGESGGSDVFTAVLKDGKKLKISGEAFGYGALEDEDGDDDYGNVYGNDDLSKYDYALGAKAKAKSTGRTEYSSSFFESGSFADHFVRHETLVFEQKGTRYAIPKDWRPKPPFPRKKASRFAPINDQPQAPIVEKQEQRRPALNAITRSLMLGEKLDLKVFDATTSNLPSVAVEKCKEPSQKDETVTFKKPLVGYFASKFVQESNASLSTQEQFNEGLTQLTAVPKEMTVVTEDKAKESGPKETVLVGKSNRDTYEWHPHKLLCKRFNVPHPYPQFPDVVGILVIERPKMTFFAKPDRLIKTVYTDKPKEEPIIEEMPNKPRPSIDIFKAIFASDEEEEDEDRTGEKEEENDRDEDSEHRQMRRQLEKDSERIRNNLQSVSDGVQHDEKPHDIVIQPTIRFNKAVIKKANEPPVKIEKSKVSLDYFDEDVEEDEPIQRSGKKEEPDGESMIKFRGNEAKIVLVHPMQNERNDSKVVKQQQQSRLSIENIFIDLTMPQKVSAGDSERQTLAPDGTVSKPEPEVESEPEDEYGPFLPIEHHLHGAVEQDRQRKHKKSKKERKHKKSKKHKSKSKKKRSRSLSSSTSES